MRMIHVSLQRYDLHACHLLATESEGERRANEAENRRFRGRSLVDDLVAIAR